MNKKPFETLMHEIFQASYSRDGEKFANAVRWGFICLDKKVFKSKGQMESMVGQSLNKKKNLPPFVRHVANLVIESVWKFKSSANLSQLAESKKARTLAEPVKLSDSLE